jgi:RNA polymerase sigma-70 factor (ECF subfamily)
MVGSAGIHQVSTDRDEATPTERELLVRTQGGDHRAMDTLIARHLPSLRAFVRLRTDSLLRAHEEDSDVVQSVCRDLFEKLDDFEYQGETRFRNWLYVAVLNKIRRKREYWLAAKRDPRRERRRDDLERSRTLLLDCYRSIATPSRHAADREQLARVEAALDRLPEHYREVITLARIVGLSQEELAEETGRSVASVRNLLSRALVRLSALLEELDADTEGSGSDRP